jgi:hypothetical protein
MRRPAIRSRYGLAGLLARGGAGYQGAGAGGGGAQDQGADVAGRGGGTGAGLRGGDDERRGELAAEGAAGHARVYLPVTASPALDGVDARWELPAGRFAVARHAGPHGDVDRTYAALGTYATAHGRDGTGPVRERYLANPLDTPDSAQWQTEVCWPLSGG